MRLAFFVPLGFGVAQRLGQPSDLVRVGFESRQVAGGLGFDVFGETGHAITSFSGTGGNYAQDFIVLLDKFSESGQTIDCQPAKVALGVIDMRLNSEAFVFGSGEYEFNAFDCDPRSFESVRDGQLQGAEFARQNFCTLDVALALPMRR